MEERQSQVTEAIEGQEELRQLAEAGDVARFLARARKLHPSDLSDIMASLDEETQIRLVKSLPPDVVSDALADTCAS